MAAGAGIEQWVLGDRYLRTLRQPEEIEDLLTNILRSGARQSLAQAIEMEAEAFLAAMKDLNLPDGRDRVVRHGHGPARTIQTGIGAALSTSAA